MFLTMPMPFLWVKLESGQDQDFPGLLIRNPDPGHFQNPESGYVGVGGVVQQNITWKQCLYNAIIAPFADVGSYPVFTEQSYGTRKCSLDVFVHGNLEQLDEKIVFLTSDAFSTHPTAGRISARFCARTRARGGKFCRRLGNGLAQIMEKLNLRKCIAIGEGAGADIVCRFAQFVIGAVLVHCTSTTHGIIASIKELFTNLLLDDGHMTNSAWNWLLVHKFGNNNAITHRDEFTDRLKGQLGKVDVLLVTGGKAPHNENVRHMFNHMTKPKTVLLVAEGVVDVVAESPEYVANSIILLCQRHGIFSDVILPIVNQQNAEDSSANAEDHRKHNEADYPATNLIFQA
uniref:Glycerate kinase n=1 Tax=Globodera pallida TaxID=36090 RepID=A0A183BM15_GLOPA